MDGRQAPEAPIAMLDAATRGDRAAVTSAIKASDTPALEESDSMEGTALSAWGEAARARCQEDEICKTWTGDRVRLPRREVRTACSARGRSRVISSHASRSMPRNVRPADGRAGRRSRVMSSHASRSMLRSVRWAPAQARPAMREAHDRDWGRSRDDMDELLIDSGVRHGQAEREGDGLFFCRIFAPNRSVQFSAHSPHRRVQRAAHMGQKEGRTGGGHGDGTEQKHAVCLTVTRAGEDGVPTRRHRYPRGAGPQRQRQEGRSRFASRQS